MPSIQLTDCKWREYEECRNPNHWFDKENALCWYVGELGKSCSTVCAEAGQPYSPQTKTITGSNAKTSGGCFQITTKIRGASFADKTVGNCVIKEGDNQRTINASCVIVQDEGRGNKLCWNKNATSESFADAKAQRICACYPD